MAGSLRTALWLWAVIACGSAAAFQAAPQSVPQPAAAAAFTAGELKSHVATLAAPDMEGRRAGTAGGARARAWVLDQFRRATLEPLGSDYQLPFSFAGRGAAASRIAGVNVAGLCKGRGASDSSAMVISAHYDHVGVQNGLVFHGADDNASGVAVLLALARHCRETPWTHDAVFVAFDAEEMGLQGARAFVANPPIPAARMAVNVNLDMLGRSDRRELYAAGTSHSRALRTILEPVAARSPIRLLFGHDTGGGQDDWTSQSDHAVFHGAGIPFVYFGVESHPDYHRPTDTADKIEGAFLLQAGLTVLDAITAIDRALPLPSR